MCKKYYSLNLSICICEYSKYSKSIVDESVTVCDEIINVTKSCIRKGDKYCANKCRKYCFNKC